MQTELAGILKLSPKNKLFIVLLFLIHLAISRVSRAAALFLLDARLFLFYGWIILAADMIILGAVERVQQRVRSPRDALDTYSIDILSDYHHALALEGTCLERVLCV
jgi:hypothetical protein